MYDLRWKKLHEFGLQFSSDSVFFYMLIFFKNGQQVSKSCPVLDVFSP